MEILIDVAEESLRVVFKVVTWIHEHGIENESIKHDNYRNENPHNQGYSVTNIGVEVVLIDTG